MGIFLICTGITLVIAILVTFFKVTIPKESYEMRTSLVLGIIAIIIFAFLFLFLIIIDSDRNALWPICYCLLFCLYIYLGAKLIAYKTATGAFSLINKRLVGHIGAGIGWIDPIFEIATISIDGIPNIAIDLQELEIEILETPDMHTATRGIKAKVKNVVFMLEVVENRIPELFEIEGGRLTIESRVLKYINFFFLDEVGKINPVDLDEDKGDTLKDLAERLKDVVNKFCEDNHYPYEIPEDSIVTVGDTELEAEYYKVLAKKEFTRLEQEAKDVEAEKLRERIVDFGKHILPGAPEKEQLDNALISLGIVKRDIQEKKYALDPELVKLAKDIASYFKK